LSLRRIRGIFAFIGGRRANPALVVHSEARCRFRAEARIAAAHTAKLAVANPFGISKYRR
jgi:hypothetical protein